MRSSISRPCRSPIDLLPTLAFGQATSAQQEANRQAVLNFYEKGLNQKDADAALKYVGDRYIQHNPNAADGPEGVRKFISFLRENVLKSARHHHPMHKRLARSLLKAILPGLAAGGLCGAAVAKGIMPPLAGVAAAVAIGIYIGFAVRHIRRSFKDEAR